jgi:hypothetical protein
LRETDKAIDFFALSILYDACLLNAKCEFVRKYFKKTDIGKFAKFSPLVFVRSCGLKDHSIHSRWIRMFRRNIFEHQQLKPPEQVGLAPPYPRNMLESIQKETVSIEKIIEQTGEGKTVSNSPTVSPEQTFKKAVGILEKIGIIVYKRRTSTDSNDAEKIAFFAFKSREEKK